MPLDRHRIDILFSDDAPGGIHTTATRSNGIHLIGNLLLKKERPGFSGPAQIWSSIDLAYRASLPLATTAKVSPL